MGRHSPASHRRAEDATYFETAEEGGALSGEEFRRILAEALNDPTYDELVQTLPWVAGSGRTTSDTPGLKRPG